MKIADPNDHVEDELVGLDGGGLGCVYKITEFASVEIEKKQFTP